jgi:hypothetical protein
MPQPFKVETSLPRDELDQLQAFVRAEYRSVDQVFEWLQAHGFTGTRSSAGRWLQDFRLEDSTRRASEIARQYLDVLRESDPDAVREASAKKFDELVFDFLVNGSEKDASDLREIAAAMKTGVGFRRENEELRRKQADAVKAAEKTAETGSPKDVVKTIKEALGLAA